MLSPTHLCWQSVARKKISLVLQRIRIAGGQHWEQRSVSLLAQSQQHCWRITTHFQKRIQGVSYWKTEIRITESENGWGWKGTLEITLSNPLLKQGHLEPAAQKHVQTARFTVFFSPMKTKYHRRKMNYLVCKLTKLHWMLNVYSILLTEGILQ